MTYGLKRGTMLLPLLAPVFVGGCVSQSSYDALQQQNQQLQSQNQQLQVQVADAQSEIARLQGAIKFTVNSDLLFPSGSWDMSPQGQQVIAKFASRLAATQTNRLVVNGYTDNAPIGPALMKQGVTSNVDLSEKRAQAVMQFLISQGVKPELLSAKGYGDADPIAPNDTAAGRTQNRRVVITLAQQG
jgi:chemotaxis protein MotB